VECEGNTVPATLPANLSATSAEALAAKLICEMRGLWPFTPKPAHQLDLRGTDPRGQSEPAWKWPPLKHSMPVMLIAI
jgi:hypothetical protein